LGEETTILTPKQLIVDILLVARQGEVDTGEREEEYLVLAAMFWVFWTLERCQKLPEHVARKKWSG